MFYERLTIAIFRSPIPPSCSSFSPAGRSGCSSAAAGSPITAPRLVARLGGRALTIYAAQILISSLALAMLAAAAYILDNPLILEWHNAAAVFQDPALAHIGLVLLTHSSAISTSCRSMSFSCWWRR